MVFERDSGASEPLGKAWHPYVVLLVGHTELRARALDVLLENTGYAVLHADSGNRALELVFSVRPDAVLVGDQLTPMNGTELCRRLTGSADFSLSTPVMLTLPETSTRSDRLEAYSAGAWSLCREPLDEAFLLLRLHTFIRARHVGERLREGSFYDGRTGLYNLDGLLLRAREIGCGSVRRRESLACVAFAPEEPGSSVASPASLDSATLDSIADSCRSCLRGSDVLGRVGGAEFAVVAPCTDDVGARGLMGRLQASLEKPAPERQVPTLRANICATSDARESSLGAVEMLMRAVSELHDVSQ
jgi:PleD family two-component response regulator